MATEEERAANSRYFRAYGRTLDMVPSFNYLGRVLLAEDDDWMVVIQNMTKARQVWRIMTSILSREGARPQVSRVFLQIRRPVIIYLWCRNVGGYPPHGTGPRGCP